MVHVRSGPARRTYALTAAGKETLERQIETLEATHQLVHTFLAGAAA